jgi:xylulokinase
MTDGDHILAIDLGTTRYKACLFDLDGTEVATASVQPAIQTDAAGRSELPLDVFDRTIDALLRELGGRVPVGFSRVRAIGYASQANSFALLDARGGALTPIVLWPDARCKGNPPDPLNELADLRAVTGLPEIDFEFAVPKLRRLLRDSEVRPRVARCASIADLLVRRFCDAESTELGLAAFTGLADMHRGTWWSAAIATLDAPVSLRWPELVRAGTPLGAVARQAIEQFGLPSDCVVVAGCLDQYAGAIGVGALSPGTFSETTGTVLAVVECLHSPAATSKDVFVGPSFAADRWFRMTFSSISANLLQAYRDAAPDAPTFEALVASARDSSTRRGAEVRAILDRVTNELARLISVLGSRPTEIRSSGGGARSDVWLQLKADRCCAPIVASAVTEPTCLGAAILAASAIGMGDVDSLALRWCKSRVRFTPQRSEGRP